MVSPIGDPGDFFNGGCFLFVDERRSVTELIRDLLAIRFIYDLVSLINSIPVLMKMIESELCVDDQ